LPLVEAIAGQIAGAIASARHHEEVRRSEASLSALSEVSRTALEVEDLDRILERIASFVQRRFDFFLVAIVVADEGMREWSHRAFALREPVALSAPSRWPISRGVVGRALRTGAAQLVPDVRADPDYFAVHPRVVAEFAAPIRWGSQILGAVNVESDADGAFPRETRELIELVATQVAGAIRFALVNWNLAETTRQLEVANAELEKLSLVDALTGVANRRRLDGALELEWRRLARGERPLSLALLDVDCFKAYNDALGHLEGDRCLRRIGELLRSAVQRAGDLAARYGGEEFAILLTETEAEEAILFADRLRAELADMALPHPASTVAPHVTASVGVATRVPRRGGTPVELVAAADFALYEAKRAGRNRVVMAAAD
jgi:diguanylate cyclase (GGDEF)-like protein